MASALFTRLLLIFSFLTAMKGQHYDHYEVVLHLYISSLRRCKHYTDLRNISPTNSCSSGDGSRFTFSLLHETEKALFLQHIITQQQRHDKDPVFMEIQRRFSTTLKSFCSLPKMKFPGTTTVARTNPAVTRHLCHLQPVRITPTLPLESSFPTIGLFN